jgi:hypothetical protein
VTCIFLDEHAEMNLIWNGLDLLLKLSESTLMENERRTLQEAQARLYPLTNQSVVSTAEDTLQGFESFLKIYIAKRQFDKSAHEGLGNNLRYEVENDQNYLSELLEWVAVLEYLDDNPKHQWIEVSYKKTHDSKHIMKESESDLALFNERSSSPEF